ncbi:MAG: hypothetical protein ACRDQ4_11505 [Pseudonocardiaceae bacterium]
MDRYPGDPARSNELYRDNPLIWDEINLHAWHGDDRAESMPFQTAIHMHFRNQFTAAPSDSLKPGAIMKALGVAHEVDHLHGILCRDHLREGVQPVPVEQYRGTGTSWHYPATMINPS